MEPIRLTQRMRIYRRIDVERLAGGQVGPITTTAGKTYIWSG